MNLVLISHENYVFFLFFFLPLFKVQIDFTLKLVQADKSSIVDEAVKYIKTLQQTLQTLQKQKVEKFQGAIIDYEPSVITSLTDTVGSREASFAALGPSKNFPLTSKMSQNSFSVSLSPACFQTWFSPNVVMNMCGNDAQFSLCSTRKPGLLATILYILEKHNLDVVSAHISSDQYRSIYMIHAHVSITNLARNFPFYVSGMR
jgi:hypothetical protein